MLGEFEIYEHQHGYKNNNKNRKEPFVFYLRERIGVHRLEFARTVRRPYCYAGFDSLNRDVVHHQREQSFICVPLCFEDRGKNRPDHARNKAGNKHECPKQTVGDFSAEIEHDCGCGKCSDKSLSVAADVPELHLERGGQRKRHAKQCCGFIKEYPESAGGLCHALNH